MALSALILVSLIRRGAGGPLGDGLVSGLRYLLGSGAWASPALLGALGVGYALDRRSRPPLDVLSGTTLLFLTFLAAAHLYGGAGASAEESVAFLARRGGVMGALLGNAMLGRLGDVGSYILLAATTVAGLLLVTDRPLARTLARFSQRGVERARRGVETAQRAKTRVDDWRARSAEEIEERRRRRNEREPASPTQGKLAWPPRLSWGDSPADDTTPGPADELDNEAEEEIAPSPELKPKSRTVGRKSALNPFLSLPVDADKGADEETADHDSAEDDPPGAQLPRYDDPFALDDEDTDLTPPLLPVKPLPLAAEPLAAKLSAPEPTAPAKPARHEPACSSERPRPSSRIIGTGDEAYVLPSLDLLTPPGPPFRLSQADRETNIRILEDTLADFKIEAKVVEICHGPTVTRYEIQLAPGTYVRKIVSLADNIAMSLAAIAVRVEAPIPGKSAIGVEVPNRQPAPVGLRQIIETPEFMEAASPLTIALGADVANQPKYADITRMPHLLVGGSTNSGKSVCLNTLICSLLFRCTPEDLKLLLIDPKRVELSLYDGIPHLVYPVVKDVRQAGGVLRWAIKEMDRRYNLLVEVGARNIDSYNKKRPEGERKLPYLVIVIDELADLMMQQGPEVEGSICRLAQLARAVGIHLIIATQRPSVDVITGTIKANISSRIAFAVASGVDSKTILDHTGAERLVGKGDMLFLPIDAPKAVRIQGAYISENEIEALVDHLKAQGAPDYEAEIVTVEGPAMGKDNESDDELFENAVRMVVTTGHASTSMLQRKFNVGYGRAARLIDMMEQKGIVGPMNNAKPRDILMPKEAINALFTGAGKASAMDFGEDEAP